MKRFLLSSSFLAFAIGCSSAVDQEGASLKDAGETHYAANHCEIFIDKVTPYQGSHASVSVAIYVKILKDRLDGEIAEVGFRNRNWGLAGGRHAEQERHNEPLLSVSPVNDYWKLALNISNEYGWRNYEGSLYVKSTKGTYYWFKPQSGGNFVFDRNTYNNAMRALNLTSSYNSGPEAGAVTQQESMSYFNPTACR